MDIIADENLIEIFVNDGEYVLSNIVYGLEHKITGPVDQISGRKEEYKSAGIVRYIRKIPKHFYGNSMNKKTKMLLTLLTKCDIVKNALLWQDMPTSLILANIKQA